MQGKCGEIPPQQPLPYSRNALSLVFSGTGEKAKARCTLLGAILFSELIMKHIVFENFGFSYPKSEKSLKGINIAVIYCYD